MMLGWDEPNNEWNTLVLGGEKLPGVWYVLPVATDRIDVKKRKGHDAARLKVHGYDPIPVTIEGTITSDEIDEWIRVLPSFYARISGGKRSPVSIVHPATQIMGVQYIVLETISAPDIDSDGFGVIRIGGMQWVKETKQKKDVPAPTGLASLDYPNWMKNTGVYGGFLNYEPPSSATDIDALAVLGG